MSDPRGEDRDMKHAFLTSSRRGFLRACGMFAAAPRLSAGTIPPIAPRQEPDWLREWNALPRLPVRASRDRVIAHSLAMAAAGQPMSFYYHGGHSPGRLRKVSPELVFRLPGHDHAYLSGYCHLRHAPRVFRIDRISLA